MAKAFAGGLAGLYTTVESMAVFGDEGRLWCAFLEDDKVIYFASHPDEHGAMPKVMEEWRERFVDRKVVDRSKLNTGDSSRKIGL